MGEHTIPMKLKNVRLVDPKSNTVIAEFENVDDIEFVDLTDTISAYALTKPYNELYKGVVYILDEAEDGGEQ